MDTLNFAKQLRQNQTNAEDLMWRELRAKRLAGFKFKRQAPIAQYFADFVCFEAKLIVELDGGQHNENPLDAKRDADLQALGFSVLRFWNNEVLQNLDSVKLVIVEKLSSAYPSPQPSPSRGEGAR